MTTVFILSINTIGCYFISDMVNHDGYRSMLNPCIDCLAKKLFDCLRLCRSCNIPVLWITSKKCIPYTATNCKTFITRFFQSVNNIFYRLWKLYIHDHPHFCTYFSVILLRVLCAITQNPLYFSITDSE